MFRALILAILAAGVALFAASLLRAERRSRGRPEATPAGDGRCVARTRSGDPCSRPAEPGSDCCWQHH